MSGLLNAIMVGALVVAVALFAAAFFEVCGQFDARGDFTMAWRFFWAGVVVTAALAGGAAAREAGR